MTDDSPRRSRGAIASTLVGVVIAVAGLGFVVRRLVADWDETRELLEGTDVVWAVLAVPVALAAMTAVGLPWRHGMRVLGHTPSASDTLRWFFPGQLGKYVPGAIWPVVGRAELAARAGVSRSVAYGSTALTMILHYLAAVIVVLVLLPFGLTASDETTGGLWVVVILPVGLLVLHPAVLRRVVEVAERKLARDVEVTVPGWRDLLETIAWHVPSWFLVGGATWLVARAFETSPHVGDVFLAAVISWIVGFVIIPVPGGIGLREAAFVAAATTLGSETAAAVAIVARLCFISADLLGALLAPLLPGGGAPADVVATE